MLSPYELAERTADGQYAFINMGAMTVPPTVPKAGGGGSSSAAEHHPRKGWWMVDGGWFTQE